MYNLQFGYGNDENNLFTETDISNVSPNAKRIRSMTHFLKHQ